MHDSVVLPLQNQWWKVVWGCSVRIQSTCSCEDVWPWHWLPLSCTLTGCRCSLTRHVGRVPVSRLHKCQEICFPTKLLAPGSSECSVVLFRRWPSASTPLPSILGPDVIKAQSGFEWKWYISSIVSFPVTILRYENDQNTNRRERKHQPKETNHQLRKASFRQRWKSHVKKYNWEPKTKLELQII